MCGNRTQDSLHHGKVFLTVMGLEEINTVRKNKLNLTKVFVDLTVKSTVLNSVTYLEEGGSEVVLNEYTTHTPHVAGMVPAEIYRGRQYVSTKSLSPSLMSHMRHLT